MENGKARNHVQTLAATARLGEADRRVLWTICGRTKRGGATTFRLRTLARTCGMRLPALRESIRILSGYGMILILDESPEAMTVEPCEWAIRRNQMAAGGAPIPGLEPFDRGVIGVDEAEGGLVISVRFSQSPKASTSGRMILLATTGGFRTIDLQYAGRPISISLNVGVPSR